MKTRLSLLISVLSLVPSALVAQSTAFTYQGRLISAGAPANGLYEMSFSLYDALTNGNPIRTPGPGAPVPVSNGLFTAALDFGANAFIGPDRWLEVSVTVFGSDQPVVLLVPRQPMTATPYALHAANAAGLMSFANGPLDIKVNRQRALRLEIATSGLGVAPNVIGGSSANIVTGGALGATIAGGGASIYDGAPVPNNVSADFGTVGGGKSNVSSGFAATVAGGSRNQ